MKKINFLFVFLYLVIFSSQSFAADRNVKYLASLCFTCHATNDLASGKISSLSGYDKKKFSEFFYKIRRSQDKSSVMYQIAQAYSEKEIMLMGEFFASHK
jgi:cytochrome c553